MTQANKALDDFHHSEGSLSRDSRKVIEKALELLGMLERDKSWRGCV
tara:strand:- start:5415 stop:5555 length:141 start_codon:yes stop_codon:yes gene_type:complete